MRKRLLTALAVVATSLLGVSSAWAQSYVTTTVNASDATKQDVTYTFNSSTNYATEGITVGSDVVAYLYDGTNTTSLYQCTTTGLDRFAFHAAQGTAYSGKGKWWWRTNGSGLQNRNTTSGVDTSSLEGFAITGLKSGDVVVVNGSNLTYGTYATLTGADEINGETQTATKGDGEANYTVTTSGNTYTYTLTSDGYITMWVYRYMYQYITSVVITEDKPDMADPTGEVTGTSGTSRIVELSCTTEDADIYYSEEELTSATGGTLYESAITTSAATIYAYATDGTNYSNVVSISTGAGTSVGLNGATFANLYYDASSASYAVKVSDDQSAILGTPEATLTYTINSGTSTDITSGSYITGLAVGDEITVTAAADGYAYTESTYTVASTGAESIDVSAVWSDNFESTSTLTTSGEFYIGTNYSYAIATAIGETTLSGNSGFYAYNSTRYKATADGIQLSNNYYVGAQNVSTDGYVVVTIAGESLTNALISGRQNVSSTISVMNADGTATIYFKPSSTTMSFNAYTGLVIKNIAFAGPYISKTIGTSGYATFSASSNTYVPDGVTVYTAAKQDESTILATAIDEATTGAVLPADEGFIIKGTAGTTYDFVTTSSDAISVTGNSLVANTTAYDFDSSNTNKYGLLSSEMTFILMTSGTLAANTAYIEIDASSAKSLKLVFEGEATGVAEIVAADENVADGKIYNLAGQQVSAAHKGIVIKNGKKYVNK